MPANFKIKMDSNAASVARDFDKLSRAEQKAVVEGSALGRQMDRVGKKGKEAGRTGSSAFAKLGKTLAAGGIVATGIGLARKGLAGVISDLEKIKAFQLGDRNVQRDFSNAVNKLVINDPSLKNDPAALNRFKDLAFKIGRDLPAADGVSPEAQVIRDIASTRSGTAGIAGDIVERSILLAGKQKTLDPELDMADAAIAIAKVADTIIKAEGLDKGKALGRAEGVQRAVGGQFAGDAASAFKNVGPILGATKSDASISEIFGLFASLSNALQDKEGNVSATILQGLLQGIQAQEVKIRGKKVNFKEKGSFKRLVEFFQRLEAGEFGETTEQKSQAINALSSGRGGRKGMQALTGIDSKMLSRSATVFAEQIAIADRDGSPTAGDLAFRNKDEVFRRTIAENRAEAEKRQAQLLAVDSGNVASRRDRFQALKDQLEIKDSIVEAVRTGDIRSAASIAGSPFGLGEGSIASGSQEGLDRESVRIMARAVNQNIDQATAAERAGPAISRGFARGGKQGAALEALRLGAVNPEDGLSRRETGFLQLAGASNTEIGELRKLAVENAKEFQALIEAIRKRENAKLDEVKLDNETIQGIGQAVAAGLRNNQPQRPANIGGL